MTLPSNMLADQLVLVVMLYVIPCLSQETFSSTTQMRALFRAEHVLLDGVEEYIVHEENRLQQLRNVVQTRRNQVASQPQRGDETEVDHPIQAYHLIKRCLQLTAKTSNEDSINALKSRLNVHGVPLLGIGDGNGAAAAIVRLQNVYNLSVEDVAHGVVNGVPATPLDGTDMFKLGQISMQMFNYGLSARWFAKALESNDTASPASDIRVHLAKAYYYIGDYENATRQIKLADELNPNNETILRDIITYTRQNETMYNHSQGVPYRTVETWQRYLPGWKGDYESLCRGESLQQDQSVLKTLGCRYRRTRIPYYRVKEEFLSTDPWIALLYDVIHDEEIETIKALATPELNRAQVGDPAKAFATDERVSKVSWLWDHNVNRLVHDLNKRVSLITGLNTEYRAVLSSSEPFQVVNYGMAGQYEPHLDFYENDYDRARVPSYLIHTGDRISTFMFYLTDVKAGGATVFPLLKVHVPPVKGAAAFWYNIKKNGDMDRRTQHAGCPVLMGEKWVANKWIREYGQEFRRRCGLSWDAEEDGY